MGHCGAPLRTMVMAGPERRRREWISKTLTRSRAKVAKCTSPEEVLELAKNEGYELSDDDIEQVVG